MPEFWANITSSCRYLAAAPVKHRHQKEYISNLNNVSNSCFMPLIKSTAKRNGKTLMRLSSSIEIVPVEWGSQTFKQLFVEHCLNIFFSLCQVNAQKTFERFIDAKDPWVQDTIKLYASANYIVSHYINTCMMQKHSYSKIFFKKMKILSNLMVGDNFDESSIFSLSIDGKQKKHPLLIEILDMIGDAIVGIFGNSNGPSGKMICLLLSNHSVLRLKGKCNEIVINHSYDNEINNALSTINKQRHSGEKLIRMIGIRTQNQCLKIDDANETKCN